MNEFRKWLLWKLGSHYYTPIPLGKRPMFTTTVPDIGDTGGGGWYRPTHRKQDPSADPREPGGGESSSAGNDHGWSNCTMASAAMALDFDTLGGKQVWGGDMRHHQSDLSGGTDLYDAADAFAAYGNALTIRTGSGWDALKADRNAGRFLIVQGQGNVPGSESFDGGHACVVGPETNNAGDWLFGDPLASGWQYCSEASIKDWMNNFHSGYAWARTDAHKPASTPPPDPEPAPPPPPPVPTWTESEVLALIEHYSKLAVSASMDDLFMVWVGWLAAPRPGQSDVWDGGSWSQPGDLPPDPCGKGVAACWSRGPAPFPLPNAQKALATEIPPWDGVGWTASLWF